LWAAAGHKVKMVSVTNGDIGHWNMAGGPLAQRRTKESTEVAKRRGFEYEVLDIHDGELEPTLENRRLITRLIRRWNADIVIAHRPWDYHPDHRYVGVLVQDAAYMVAVPFFCPDTPPLQKNPVFLYSSDRFQKPYPFKADIAVAVDAVFVGFRRDDVRCASGITARAAACVVARALGATSVRRGSRLPSGAVEMVWRDCGECGEVRGGI